MTIKSKISLAASTALVAVTLFSGCNSDDINPTTTITGKVIDGYVSGATISFNGRTSTSDDDGDYSIEMETAYLGSTSQYVTSTSGTDTSTAVAFEGSMTSLSPASSSNTVVNISPVTTVVQAYAAANATKTKSESEQVVADLLSIDVGMMTEDPVAILTDSSNTNYANAQTYLKSAIQVQKVKEAMLDSGVTDPIASMITTHSTSTSTTMNDIISETITSNITDTSAATAIANVSALINNIEASTDITDASSFAEVASTIEAISEAVESSIADNTTTSLTKALNISKAAAITGITKLKAEYVAAGSVSAMQSTYSDDTVVTDKAAVYDATVTAVADAGGDLSTVLAANSKSTSDVATVITSTYSNADTTTVSSTEETAKTSTNTKIGSTVYSVTSNATLTLLGKTISIGTSSPKTSTIGANSFDTISLSTGTSSSYLYSMSIASLTASKAFETQTITISTTLTNKNDTTDTVKMTLANAQLTGDSSGNLTLSIPSGTSVTITETAGSTTSSYTGTTNATLTNTDLSVNFDTILSNLTSATSINSGLAKADTRLASTGNYTLDIAITGISTSVLKLDYTTFSGTINVQ